MTYKDIDGYFDYSDIYQEAVDRAPAKGSVFVELGTFRGKSAAYMAQAIKSSGKQIAFHCVDTWAPVAKDSPMYHYMGTNEGAFELFKDNLTKCGLLQYVHPIQMYSCQAASLFQDKTVDFVFVDAGHTYESVHSDIIAWLPKLKSLGHMAGHDYDWPDIAKAVSELIKAKQRRNCWEKV